MSSLFPPSDIGGFVIGESPIGTEPALQVEQTIISQYANSPTLTLLCLLFQQWLDPTGLVDAFYDMVWNIETASGYGLDVWGRIVGVNRFVSIPNSTAGPFWGFQQGSYEEFDQAPFYNGALQATETVALPDSAFQRLILAKALANISDGSIKGMNAILRFLFPDRGNCYVQDNLNMSLVYVFNFPLTPTELATVVQSGVLPRPCGVSTTYSVA